MSQLKAVKVKMPGKEQGAEDERVLLQPGTKVSDLLKQINAPAGFGIQKDGEFLKDEDDIFSRCKEGDLLYVSQSMPFGRRG